MQRLNAQTLISLGNEEFLKSAQLRAADPRSERLVERAIRRYTLALLEEPSNGIAFHNRGLARQKKEDLRGAIEDFRKAFELNPSEGIIKRSLNEAIGEQARKQKLEQTDARGKHLECLVGTKAA